MAKDIVVPIWVLLLQAIFQTLACIITSHTFPLLSLSICLNHFKKCIVDYVFVFDFFFPNFCRDPSRNWWACDAGDWIGGSGYWCISGSTYVLRKMFGRFISEEMHRHHYIDSRCYSLGVYAVNFFFLLKYVDMTKDVL